MTTRTKYERSTLRGGTATAVATLNETPLAREIIVETDSKRVKLGDGTTPYNALPYWDFGGVESFNGRTGVVTLTYADVTGALGFTPVSVSGAVAGVAAAVTGIIKSNGTALSAAAAGTDFVAPGAAAGSGLTAATKRLIGRTTAGSGALEEIGVDGTMKFESGTIGVGGFPGYASGKYYFADGIGVPATSLAGAANTLHFHPFVLLADVSIANLVAKVATAASGGLFQFGLYAADPTTKYPTGAALFASGSFSTTSTVQLEATGVGLTLKAGLYWAASNKDTAAAAATFMSNSISQFRTGQLVPADTAADLMSGITVGLSGYARASTPFGTWPTLTGNLSADGLARVSTTIVPVVAFKVA